MTRDDTNILPGMPAAAVAHFREFERPVLRPPSLRAGRNPRGGLGVPNCDCEERIECDRDASIFNFADPIETSEAAIALYGSNASVAVASAAFTARFAGRKADFRFWYTVFLELRERDDSGRALNEETPSTSPTLPRHDARNAARSPSREREDESP